jgi:hypothetical protein
MGCNIKFKTKKQKLIHHNKMELECKTEKNSLIKLIRSYKILLARIVMEGGNGVKSLEEYETLKKLYDETESKLLDPDYFHCLLGKSFEEVSKVDLNEVDFVNKEDEDDDESEKE